MQLRNQLDPINPAVADEETRTLIRKLQENIVDQLQRIGQSPKNQFVLLLGGYKGLLLSGPFRSDEVNSAIYLDQHNHLPHGLVQLTLE